ncbi:hypothetical protein Tco_1020738, partial [Tanacetum coccineum]
LDKAYVFRGIRRIGNWTYAFSCEVQALIHRVFFAGYGVLNGWKAGCRKIIALDGCFLKTPDQGEILTIIGRGGNNHIYPVAWAVGLIEAVKDVMPNAEHRQCARHIYENFRKQYPGLEFRQLFWAASKASYPQLFNKIMDKIKSANPNAHKYLMDKNPKTWSRAFFEVNRGCEAIENGFSECFNSVIVNVRHKLLLTMLEAIRVIVLERMNKMREISRKWNPGVCPNIKKKGTTKDVAVIRTTLCSGHKGVTNPVGSAKRPAGIRGPIVQRYVTVWEILGYVPSLRRSGGDVFDIIGDVDPTDEDEDIGMGDSTGVSTSLGGEFFSGGMKCREIKHS